MSFEPLLGNERLKNNLINSLRRGRSSHFYLISGPEGSGKHTLARLLAAAMMCSAPEKPCLCCAPCRKVMEGLHPDFITVDDPEKKTVPVALIRQAREDVFVRPNQSDKKVYLFPRAQDMGVPGQNALLKILEEPPGYGVFLLLTDNAEKILPTVRSRCTELSLQPLPGELLRRQLQKQFPQVNGASITAAIARSGGFLGQAQALLNQEQAALPQTQDFITALCEKNHLLLTQTLLSMDKWKREALLDMLQQWIALAENAMACRAGMSALSPLAESLAAARSPRQLSHIIGQLQKAVQYALANVSPAAICGHLVWALK